MSTHMVANELMAWRRLVLRYQHESSSHNRDSQDGQCAHTVKAATVDLLDIWIFDLDLSHRSQCRCDRTPSSANTAVNHTSSAIAPMQRRN